MRTATTLLLSACLLAATAVAAQTPAARRVLVDCEAGDSVAAAAALPADELLIEIRGLCTEALELRRDRVTLRGGNPFRDGIEVPADASSRAALEIAGARFVTVENLRLTGGRAGLRVSGAHDGIEVLYSRLEGNRRWGAELVDASVRFQEVAFTANGEEAGDEAAGGLLATRGSSARCVDCVIAENPEPGENFGAVAFAHSTITLTGGAVEGATAVLARVYASASLVDVDVAGGEWAFETNVYGRLAMRGGLLSGPFLASGHASVELFGVGQVLNATQNFVAERATLLVADRPFGDERPAESSTLDGITLLTDHADAKLEGATVIEELRCGLGARLLCDATATAAVTSGCSCP